MSVAVVVPSVVAVVGTLAGGLLTGLLQARLSRTTRLAGRDEARRDAVLSATAALVSALADHRRAMWVRENLRLSGAEAQTVAEARAASHVTRSAVTTPLVTVTVLAPALGPVARQAVEATYALRNAADRAMLTALRESAMSAVDRFVTTAARQVTR